MFSPTGVILYLLGAQYEYVIDQDFMNNNNNSNWIFEMIGQTFQSGKRKILSEK